jgi:hypothetical protein
MLNKVFAGLYCTAGEFPITLESPRTTAADRS